MNNLITFRKYLIKVEWLYVNERIAVLDEYSFFRRRQTPRRVDDKRRAPLIADAEIRHGFHIN